MDDMPLFIAHRDGPDGVRRYQTYPDGKFLEESLNGDGILLFSKAEDAKNYNTTVYGLDFTNKTIDILEYRMVAGGTLVRYEEEA